MTETSQSLHRQLTGPNEAQRTSRPPRRSFQVDLRDSQRDFARPHSSANIPAICRDIDRFTLANDTPQPGKV